MAMTRDCKSRTLETPLVRFQPGPPLHLGDWWNWQTRRIQTPLGNREGSSPSSPTINLNEKRIYYERNYSFYRKPYLHSQGSRSCWQCRNHQEAGAQVAQDEVRVNLIFL